MLYVDGDVQPLDGERRYELRFAAPPPCRAFWSVTMYDTPDFYLVDNPIDRYSIGDRTPGLQTAPDGSLVIVMQQNEPSDPDHRANWLPTPAGHIPAAPSHLRARGRNLRRRLRATTDHQRQLDDPGQALSPGIIRRSILPSPQRIPLRARSGEPARDQPEPMVAMVVMTPFVCLPIRGRQATAPMCSRSRAIVGHHRVSGNSNVGKRDGSRNAHMCRTAPSRS